MTSEQPAFENQPAAGSPPPAMSDLPALTLTDELRDAIRQRLTTFRALDELEAERGRLLQNAALPGDARAELERQSRELNRLPSAAQAQQALDKQRRTLTQRAEQAMSGEVELPNDDYLTACKLAQRQWDRLIDGEKRLRSVVKLAATLAHGEPLFAVLRQLNIASAASLFAYHYYFLALDVFSTELAAGRAKAQKDSDSLPQTPTGLLRRSHEPSAEEAGVQNTLAELGQWAACVERERRAIEPQAVEAFWTTYDSAAKYWVAGQAPAEGVPRIRAFLRWGLLSTAPAAFDEALSRWMIAECSGADPRWCDSMTITHVLYADEYLYFAGHGVITPSFDEDLELNERNSPAWIADKAHRRAIHTRIAESAFKELYAQLVVRIKQLRAEQSRADVERRRYGGSDPASKAKAREWSEKFQAARVAAGRYDRATIRIRSEYVPRQIEIRQDSIEKLKTCGARLSRNHIVQREVAGVRRASKLVNQLKEPFLPMTLCERFRPDLGGVHLREAVVEAIGQHEVNDPTVFKTPLMPSRKRENEIYLRYSPVVLLTPSLGCMGFSWNPRAGSEVGRIALPGYCPRGGLTQRMLAAVLADFRWDTAKAAGGLDQLKSDSLCAEYATVRWNYRKRAKDVREKAAIYTEQNDRANWRRHYELYLSSAAADGGKRLFYKCPDVYEVVLRYMRLPDGVERCRHG